MISRSVVEIRTEGSWGKGQPSKPLFIATLPELLEQLVIEAKKFGRISFLDAENNYKRFDFVLYAHFTFDLEEVAIHLQEYAQSLAREQVM